MSLTQKIQDALSAANLPADNFTLSSPDSVGGITVESTTNDAEQIAAAEDALKPVLPPAEYALMLNRSMTDPSIYVRTR